MVVQHASAQDDVGRPNRIDDSGIGRITQDELDLRLPLAMLLLEFRRRSKYVDRLHVRGAGGLRLKGILAIDAPEAADVGEGTSRRPAADQVGKLLVAADATATPAAPVTPEVIKPR